MKRHAYLFALLFTASTLPLAAQASHPLEATLMGGAIFSSLSNNETVQVHPLVTNTYHTDEQTQSGALAGASVGYAYPALLNRTLTISLALAGYYLNYGDVEGTEYPFSNAGSFDTLDYHFKAHSYAVMLEPKFVYTKYSWQPYVFVGLGSAWNRLYNYKEKPTNPAGTAAPAVNGFDSNTVNAFAYEVGVGIQHEFAYRPSNMFRYRLAADYRYMNMGQADLGTMPGQLTDGHLEVSPLQTQALVISFTTLF